MQYYSENALVEYDECIYKIKKYNVVNNEYQLELIAHMQNSLQNINMQALSEVIVKQELLKPFTYNEPQYILGHRFGNGEKIYLIIFTNNSHEYRYNLESSSGAIVNLPESDLSWR